jgi:MprA protease rhombosortase-interaction domain-containing protein
MKISNWRNRLSATLVACGLLSPCVAHAAELEVNLLINGGFENVDLATTGNYNGPRILDWTGPNMFAYSHNGSSSSAGVVPDYADGPDPPGAGNWYFSSNNTGVASPTDVREPRVFYQDIDVSSGPSATAISTGGASYTVFAYFSSYLNDADIGSVRVDMLDVNGTILFGDNNSDQDAGPDNVWSTMSTTLGILQGTTTLRVSLYGQPVNGGADGYIDNVSLFVHGVPEPSSALLLAMAGLSAGCLRKRPK